MDKLSYPPSDSVYHRSAHPAIVWDQILGRRRPKKQGFVASREEGILSGYLEACTWACERPRYPRKGHCMWDPREAKCTVGSGIRGRSEVPEEIDGESRLGRHGLGNVGRLVSEHARPITVTMEETDR